MLPMDSYNMRLEALHMRSGIRGYESFVRSNPMSDKFAVRHFHHVEFYCGDATNTYKRFARGLGMKVKAKSDLTTGNLYHSTYVLESGDMKMLFTAPSSRIRGSDSTTIVDNDMPEHLKVHVSTEAILDDSRSLLPFPNYNIEGCRAFFDKHGLGVSAVAIEVDNVEEAFDIMMVNGAAACLTPIKVVDKNGLGSADIAEVRLYGDVVLRLVNLDNFRGVFMPNFEEGSCVGETYGIERFDHIVGNVWNLESIQSRLMSMTGFHTFAEFVAEDVGTVDSGLNSVVLASNNEKVLLPLNEPTFGTRKKSQIQTYLEQNNGAGVQHMALFTFDIFETMRKMRAASDMGGFEFMPAQPPSYYRNLSNRIGKDVLSADQLRWVEELGLLVDRDDQGVLVQIFTKPVGDRPTLFLEIIQRMGCDTPGCGGFGKGNFKDLFKSIEDFEDTLQT